MSEQEWNPLPDQKKEKKSEKMKLEQVKEIIAKGDETYIALAKKFLNNIELDSGTEDKELTKEVINDLFQTATRAIGLMEVMKYTMNKGPQEAFSYMAASVEAIIRGSKVVGLMEEFEEFLEAKKKGGGNAN